LNIPFKEVTRNGNSGTLSFQEFVLEINGSENVLVVQAAKLSKEDILSVSSVIHPNARLILISSVAVYGNSVLSNKIAPINKYGLDKLFEEYTFLSSTKCYVLRLANIYGGSPETSGVLSLYNEGRLDFIEIDGNQNELMRDYVRVEHFLLKLKLALSFNQNTIVNVSSGIGLSIKEFFSLLYIETAGIKRRQISEEGVILKSVIDQSFIKSHILLEQELFEMAKLLR
jgi:nucleoside-diphosphate-sugar epimerase